MSVKGSIGEISAQLHFIKEGYQVYSPATDNAKFDFIVERNGKLLTIEVRSTEYMRDDKYIVSLKNTRPNRTKATIHNFDNSELDLLVVYVIPLDLVLVYDAKNITQKTEMRLDI